MTSIDAKYDLLRHTMASELNEISTSSTVRNMNLTESINLLKSKNHKELKSEIETKIVTFLANFEKLIQREQSTLEYLKSELEHFEKDLEKDIAQVTKADHLSGEIENLDKVQFELVSEINKQETETTKQANLLDLKLAKLQALKDQVSGFEDQELENSRLHSQEMKLRLFQSMGVIVSEPELKTEKVLVQKPRGLETHVLETSGYSNFFISNFIWDRL
ncbi:unnamed protein product [Kuraishia capsulata CBS 1993]|uniref:Kinetochore protein Spc24 n=1 Tax=Kuraishia capsulata CBS 1993 TaxID=1382522 RepID=W6MFN5_9ASCO|nr:uncharacterized protein KUCA_T00000640001 [Kuraishia capsulata CBS 1993]CDK24674.1 unnamed protein product [Kuraishia capsulata CBS 1993]